MPTDLELMRRIFRRTVVDVDTGCWICQLSLNSSHGYANMKTSGRMFGCHREVYRITKGPIPFGLCVMHTCDNRRCVNPNHLMLGTNADNMKDGAVKNRFVHKLELSQIGSIRRLVIEGFSQTAVAKMFGLHQATVSKIVNRKRRQHV